jgi:hypothetical protein
MNHEQKLQRSLQLMQDIKAVETDLRSCKHTPGWMSVTIQHTPTISSNRSDFSEHELELLNACLYNLLVERKRQLEDELTELGV